MEIKDFIEKAREGGWEQGEFAVFNARSAFNNELARALESEIVLNRKAWQAVGKVEGWQKTDLCFGCGYDEGATIDIPMWLVNMHKMIDALAEDKTIEEYIATL